MRGAAALLVVALLFGLSGCSKDKQGRYGLASAISAGVGAGLGPDAVSGSGGQSVTTSPPGIGPAVNSGFVLTNGRVQVNIDAVGTDPSFTLPGSFDDGPALENTVAPSGGNLVDVGLVGRADDQFMIAGLAVLGRSDDGVPNTQTATENLVFNFLVLPDTDTTLYPTFSGGLAPKQLRSGGTRRVVTVGVILNLSDTGGRVANGGTRDDPTEPIGGTVTYTRGEVTAAGTPGLPAEFHANIPAAIPLLVDRSLLDNAGVPQPIFVITMYALAPHSNALTITSTIMNVGTEPIGITNLVQIVGTGAFNKNLDVLLGGVAFAPDDTNTFRPTVQTLTPAGNFGIAGARYVSFIGRDEPGISYTFCDTLAGAIVAQREAAFLTQLVQLRSDLNIAPEDRLTWIRQLFVGARADSASSADMAVQALATSAVRGVFGAGGGPNAVTHYVEVSGVVANAPEGTIVRISERNPTFFSPVTPNTVSQTPGIFGPLLQGVQQVSAGDVPVATARVGGHGRWHALVPVGFKLDVAVPGGGVTTIDVPYSDLRFDVFAPGAELPVTGATDAFATYLDPSDGDVIYRVTRDQHRLSAGRLDLAMQLSLGKLVYEIRDESGQLMPGTLRIVRTDGSGAPLTVGAIDVGIPTGLEESLERATGAGGTVYTATGRGEVSLHAGNYLVIANRGIEYELDSSPLVISAGGTLTHTFTLKAVSGMGDGAISGDFHVHAGPSSDSSVPVKDRVISYLAQGVEILGNTDHDNVRSYAPALDEVRKVQPALDDMLHVITGVELTTDLAWGPFSDGLGHWNAFPIPYQPGVRKGGAPEDELRPASVFGLALRLADGVFGNEILQINHPRAGEGLGTGIDGGDGLLTNLGKENSDTKGVADALGGSFDPLDRLGVAMLLAGEPAITSGTPEAAQVHSRGSLPIAPATDLLADGRHHLV